MYGYDSNSLQVTFSTSQHLSPDTANANNYRTVTNLRVQLLDQFVEIELSGPRFQYYSLSEWLIWGSCLCNGHASRCTPRDGETLATNKVTNRTCSSVECAYVYFNQVYTGCICGHNTQGNNCEMCQIGFNSAPWMPGTSTAANQCQGTCVQMCSIIHMWIRHLLITECMCNGHANDCEYIASQSSVVCLNCTENTTGDNCDLCLPEFYQDEALLLNDPAICNRKEIKLINTIIY